MSRQGFGEDVAGGRISPGIAGIIRVRTGVFAHRIPIGSGIGGHPEIFAVDALDLRGAVWYSKGFGITRSGIVGDLAVRLHMHIPSVCARPQAGHFRVGHFRVGEEAGLVLECPSPHFHMPQLVTRRFRGRYSI